MRKANNRKRNVGRMIKNIILGRNIFQVFFRVYILIILLGAIFLYTDWTHNSWEIKNTTRLETHRYTFWNALFIACSAFSNTGLTCFNIENFYNFFGEFVIFLLIWFGGIGIISIFYVIWNLFRKTEDVKLNQIILLQSERGTTKLNNTFKSIRFSVAFIICVQLFFGFIYSFWLCWMPIYKQDFVDCGYNVGIGYDLDSYIDAHDNYAKALWVGMFSSFSAINNAGFDLFEQNVSLGALKNDWNFIFQFLVIIEIIIGGIGYPLIFDIYQKIRAKKLNLQHKFTLFSKVCLIAYFTILGIGLIFVYGFEFGAVNTSGLPDHTSLVGINNDNHKYWGRCELFNKCTTILFNTISTRSAGFYTIDPHLFTVGSQTIFISLMFIGGSPSSTAGGIRITTFVVLMAAIISAMRGRANTSLFKRNIPKNTVIRSYLVFFFALMLILFTTLIVLYSPSVEYPHTKICELLRFSFFSCLFEVVSAFGTVGYTMGITAIASPLILSMFVLCMFVGQLGVSNTLLLWVKRSSIDHEINYAEEDIRIG